MKNTPFFSAKLAGGTVLLLLLLFTYFIQGSFAVLFIVGLLLSCAYVMVLLLLFGGKKIEGWVYTLRFYLVLAFRYSTLFFLLLTTLLGSMLVYYNEISPATLSLYTITNGDKTVQFQSMSHIATPAFYKQVASRVQAARGSGATIFFEGVRVEKENTLKDFQKALGFELKDDTYEKLAHFVGLTAQNSENTGIHKEVDKNIDVNLEDIMAWYKKKASEKNVYQTQLQTTTPANVEDLLQEAQKTLTPPQRSFLSYVVRGIANSSLDTFSDEASMKNFGKEAILSTIIEERNKIVADAIIKSKEKKIFVLYGALHFSGIYELLSKNDSNWHIVREELSLPY